MQLRQTVETTALLSPHKFPVLICEGPPQQQTSPFKFLTVEAQQGSIILIKCVKLYILPNRLVILADLTRNSGIVGNFSCD